MSKSSEQSPMVLSPCACIGPIHGEPLCHCMMINEGLPRSKEFLAAQKQSEKMLPELMLKIFSKSK